MEETVISWNLPNIMSVILMVLIIWIVFGFVGHFVFRKGAATSAPAALQPAPDMQVLGA